MTAGLIEIRNVCKDYDGTTVLKNVSLDVERGELLVLLGSSGSGKSTLLKTINGLVEPSTGSVSFAGRPVSGQDPVELRRSLGYVFQQVGLFPHLSVFENVTLVLRLEGRTEEQCRERFNEVLKQVSLDPRIFADRFPSELSGGEQQRVGVARALATNPDCILMDEPFGAVDTITRDGLQQEVLQLKSDRERTIVFVTHDLFEALTLADRVAVLHQGRLEQVGTPREVMSEPATTFVRDLFERPLDQLRELGLLQ
jgi:osmoprotectant transport system ATP-binding protein